MSTDHQASKAMSTARTSLLLNQPFFGMLALRLGMQAREDISTLAVDGKQMFYNPDFVLALPPALRSSAIAHEVMHCVFEHVLRRGTRDPQRWNRAADYVVNPTLKEAGLSLGTDWLYDTQYLGMTAEQVYSLLPESEGGGSGDAPLCDVMPAPADSSDAREELAVEWKLATVQAAKAQLSRGALPGTLRKLLDDALHPPIPWRDVLANFMTERVKDDYSWRRPNPYYVQSGFFLPSMDGIGMGEVVIALDTSGSVVSVLDEFGTTVKDVITSCQPTRVHVIYCDAKVNRVDTFERGTTPVFEAVGGGGTSFRPVFDYVERHNLAPACLLYLTDMYGSFPDTPPGYPVLWCATSDKRGPFGDTLRIKE